MRVWHSDGIHQAFCLSEDEQQLWEIILSKDKVMAFCPQYTLLRSLGPTNIRFGCLTCLPTFVFMKKNYMLAIIIELAKSAKRKKNKC